MKTIACLMLAAAALCVALAALFAFVPTADAHVEGLEQYTPWFMAQRVPDDNKSDLKCCDQSDAYALTDEQIRIVDHEPEAEINGHWVRFPDRGVGKPGNRTMGYTGNPTGKTIAWLFQDQPRCLSFPTGS